MIFICLLLKKFTISDGESTTLKVTFTDITNPKKKKKVNVAAEILSDKLKKKLISHPKSAETNQTLACKYLGTIESTSIRNLGIISLLK